MPPHAVPRQLSQLQAPAICFDGRSRLPFARPPNASAGLARATLAATGPSHLFCSLERPSKQMAGACSCESCLGKACGSIWGRANGSLERPSKVMAGACSCESCLGKACGSIWGGQAEGRSRLPFARPQMLPQALPRQLSQLQAPAICFEGRSRLQLARPKCFRRPCQGNSRSYRPQPLLLKGVQGCRLPGPKCFRRPCQGNSRSYRPQPSVFKGVQGCRLPAPKCLALPGQLSQLQAPAERP